MHGRHAARSERALDAVTAGDEGGWEQSRSLYAREGGPRPTCAGSRTAHRWQSAALLERRSYRGPRMTGSPGGRSTRRSLWYGACVIVCALSGRVPAQPMFEDDVETGTLLKTDAVPGNWDSFTAEAPSSITASGTAAHRGNYG